LILEPTTQTLLGLSLRYKPNQGLSEYTNSNFFSHSTIFAADRFSTNDGYYFPNPTKASTDLQSYIDKNKTSATDTVAGEVVDKSNYVSKTSGGETLTYLARQGVSTPFVQFMLGEGKSFYSTFKLDDACYYDYSKKIIPMTVGYSTALLQYFFRGDLTATIPSDTPPASTRIRLNVRNSTESGETMDGGSIELMAIFRRYQHPDSLSGTLTLGDYEFHKYTYAGCSGPSASCTIDKKDQVYDFDLSNDPIPPLASDISLVVVYRGKLGNEPVSVAYDQIFVDNPVGDLKLSLPARGVYASASASETSNTFTDFSIAAQNTSGESVGPGTTELLLIYRDGDPLLPHLEGTPSDPKYVRATINSADGMSDSAASEFSFNLLAGLPINATDVYAYVIRTDANGVATYGYRDISEPTPVDLYNNTDYVCLDSQWYSAGDPAAIAKADQLGNHNGFDDDTDTFHHIFTNLYAKISALGTPLMASATNYDLSDPGPVAPGTLKRLGYILADYSYNYSFLLNFVHVDSADGWTGSPGAMQFSGTAVKNQTDPDGTYVYPGMYMMRGTPMWGGLIYNIRYPAGSSCDWKALPLSH
jgi:hypothetical protein